MTLIEIQQKAVPDGLYSLLHKLHDACGQDTSDRQSMRGGTQITLTECRHPVYLETMREIASAVRVYLPEQWEFAGVWSIRLPKGGYHVEHNHPKGRVSGCFYVDVPEETSGHLVINGRELPVKSGMLVLFPSQMPHGTTVYEGEKPRLTMAFDVSVQ